LAALSIVASAPRAQANCSYKPTTQPIYLEPNQVCDSVVQYHTVPGLGLVLYIQGFNPPDNSSFLLEFQDGPNKNGNGAAFRFNTLSYLIGGTNNGQLSEDEQAFGPYLFITDRTQCDNSVLLPLSEGHVVQHLANGVDEMVITAEELGFTPGDVCSADIEGGTRAGHCYLGNVAINGVLLKKFTSVNTINCSR